MSIRSDKGKKYSKENKEDGVLIIGLLKVDRGKKGAYFCKYM